VAVSGVRSIGKTSMIHNNALPHIEVDPETYESKPTANADCERPTCCRWPSGISCSDAPRR